MPVEIREVKTKRALRDYINLAAKIHKNHNNWLPPLYADEWNYYNPSKNKAFSYSDTILLLAYKDNLAVGRIFGIINNRYNELHKEKHARFAFFECYNDEEVFHALINYVENWSRDKGMTKLIGPFGFSDKDPEGFLIEGFEHLPIFVTPCNFEYMPQLLINEGYTKKVDCHDFLINIKDGSFENYHRILTRINNHNTYDIVEFQKSKELKKYIRPVLKLMNECYSDIYGYIPLTDEEMDDLAKRYLPIINPEFVKVVKKDDELIAFTIALPNMSKGIIRSKGKLFPFGILHIMRAAKKAKQLDLMLGGIKEKYRGTGVDVLMGIKLLESCKKKNIEEIESHLILETNVKMIAEVERIGGKIHKRFRIFQKDI